MLILLILLGCTEIKKEDVKATYKAGDSCVIDATVSEQEFVRAATWCVAQHQAVRTK